MNKTLFVIVLVSVFSVHAEVLDVNLVSSVGMTFGGDTLASRTDGPEIEAGGMMYFAMGGVFKLSEDIQLQTNFGYHYDSIEASNGSAKFSRTFVELIPYYLLTPKTRFGVGVVNAFSPELEVTGDTFGYGNSLGIIGEVNWRFSRKAWWGFRYVNIEYTVNNYNGISITNDVAVANGLVSDGSYFGLMLYGGF